MGLDMYALTLTQGNRIWNSLAALGQILQF